MLNRETINFPNRIIIDIRIEVLEFMNIFKPGELPDISDFVFVEEVLTTVGLSFMDFDTYRNIVINSLESFADGTIRYSDCDNVDLLLKSVIWLTDSIIQKLMRCGAYVDGVFPYVFQRLTLDYALIFEYAPELIGDRYIDPYRDYIKHNTSSWL